MKKNERDQRTSNRQNTALVILYQVVRWLPDLVNYRILSPLFAVAVFLFVPSLRRAAESNMRQVAKAQGVSSNLTVWVRVLLVLLHNGYNWADHVRIPRINIEQLRGDVEMVGLEHIKGVGDRCLLVGGGTSRAFY